MSNAKKRGRKRPQTKEQVWRMMGRLRIGELNKLFRWRYRGGASDYELPDDDSGREDLMILLHHYANSNPLQMTKIIKLRAPWMGVDERRSVLDRVAAYPWRWRSETLGRRLRVTKAEWQSLNLRTIAPVDMTRNERSEERKLRNRLRMHHKRRREGRKSRAEYECNSLSRTKPWLAEGISRRTWERRSRADEKACRKCVSHKDIFKAEHTLATSEQAATSSTGRPSKDRATIGAEARSHRDRVKREGEYHARKQRPAPILSHPNFFAKATRNDLYLAPTAGDSLEYPRRTEADGQPAGQECSHLARFWCSEPAAGGPHERATTMSQPRRIPAHSELLRTDTIRPDRPLRLNIAAALAYPDGSMTASGLRREHKRGRLIIERTAGKDYNCAGGWRHE
jgi:hypothetical protein